MKMRNEIIVFLLSLCVYLFLKYQKSILEKDTLTKIQSKILVSGFGTSTILFAVLFAVLWLTDYKLGWFSYMTRDWWTFGAFVVAYIAFAPAFMQEKDKAKKTPVFKKAMVFITIMAVILSFTDCIKNPFGAKSDAEVTQQTVQVTPQTSAGVTETIVANGDHFTYKNIPDGVSVDWICPGNALMDFTYVGMPEEQKGWVDCGETVKERKERGISTPLIVGKDMPGRRVGFMPKDNSSVTVLIKMGATDS